MLRRISYAVIYFFKFMKELTMANYQVAKLVLSPSAKLKPGFIAVPLTAVTRLRDHQLCQLDHPDTGDHLGARLRRPKGHRDARHRRGG